MSRLSRKALAEQHAELLFGLRRTLEKARAFSVHILTASGAYVAFLSLIAAAEHRFDDMFWWLGLALLIDGIDGPLARKLNIIDVLPKWSGETLDNIIDYATYVLIPAFAFYQSGMVNEPMSFLLSGLIVVSSAVYYADTGMKTEEKFFRGFPVVWNMVIFTLFAINATEATAVSVIVFAVALTFTPVHFLHPVRVVRLRPLNLTVFAIWNVLGICALLMSFDVPVWLKTAMLAASAYMFLIGAVLQAFPKLGLKEDKTFPPLY